MANGRAWFVIYPRTRATSTIGTIGTIARLCDCAGVWLQLCSLVRNCVDCAYCACLSSGGLPNNISIMM